MSARPLGGRDIAALAIAFSFGIAFVSARSPLLALLAVGGLVFVAWVVTRAELVLMVVVATIPWEAMLEYPSATVSIAKLLGLALVAAYVFRATTQGEKVRFPPTVIIGLILGMLVCLSLIASTDPSSGVSKGFRYGFFIAFMFLVTQLVDNRRTAIQLLKTLCVSASAAAVFGLFLFLTGVVDRAYGPLHDANDFGYLMATVIPIAVMLYIDDRKGRLVWGTSLLLLFGATLATLSRGALVGLAALAIWAVMTRRIGAGGILWTAFGVTAVVAVAFTFWSPLINERLEQKNRIGNTNVESRIVFWSAASQMSLDYPVLGIGPDRFGEEAPGYLRNSPLALHNPVVHNSYLELLAENGIFALAAFLALLTAAWRAVARAEREARARRDFEGAHLAAAIKGMLIVAVVSGMFLSEQLTTPFWLACGLAGSSAFAAEYETRRRKVATALRPARA